MNQLDVAALRRDFPVLDRTIYGKPLIYLDNTATSQTPSCVVDTIRDIYFHTKANVHRGVHTMSQEMTAMQEDAEQAQPQQEKSEETPSPTLSGVQNAFEELMENAEQRAEELDGGEETEENSKE